jgi:hypothetical protein
MAQTMHTHINKGINNKKIGSCKTGKSMREKIIGHIHGYDSQNTGNKLKNR